jgi:hypothetical protein
VASFSFNVMSNTPSAVALHVMVQAMKITTGYARRCDLRRRQRRQPGYIRLINRGIEIVA